MSSRGCTIKGRSSECRGAAGLGETIRREFHSGLTTSAIAARAAARVSALVLFAERGSCYSNALRRPSYRPPKLLRRFQAKSISPDFSTRSKFGSLGGSGRRYCMRFGEGAMERLKGTEKYRSAVGENQNALDATSLRLDERVRSARRGSPALTAAVKRKGV